MASSIQQFLKEHGISEVEAIIPDMAGVARGKLMPAEKFAEEEGMRLPEAIFLQTVTGDYPDDQSAMNPSDIDIVLKADPKTVRVVPWAAEPTAQVIHDCFYGDGRPVTMAPRYVLRRVLELYEAHGWEPVVAPELEFFLVEPNIDSDYPLKPPVGRSGRPEIGRQAYSIAAVNEFDPLFDDMYSFCEAQDIEIDTLIHESGAAQMEINLTARLPDEPCRPGLSLQTHRARGRDAPQDVRHVHGQADGQGTGQRHASSPEHRGCEDPQEHLQQRRRLAILAVLRTHRRAAKVPAGQRCRCSRRTSTAIGASAAIPRRRSTCTGDTTIEPPDCGCPCPEPKRGVSRTAWAGRMRIRTSPSPPLSRAAISA